jgi:2-polyprenyl-3-methyl-5-hydroxy-6-metoxy-1,4-benzoquinol methylase
MPDKEDSSSDRGKASQYGCAMAGPRINPESLSLWISVRVTDSPQKGAKRLKTSGWVSWNVSSTRSRRRRELVQPGWRCLEVGAGRGAMAVWLAERVGESGQVVAPTSLAAT